MSDLLPEEFEPEVEELVEEEPEEDLSFLDELETEVPEGFEYFVKLRTTTGSSQYVPIDEPMTINDILSRADLRPTVGTEFWFGGVSVDPATTEVGFGAEVVVVGSFKGA